MQIRNLAPEEIEQRIALSEFAFQFKLAESRREEEKAQFRPEDHLGAFDEQGRLMSALILIPLECWVHGRPMRMGGVAGVATWPEFRRSGCVTGLLARSLELMREQGQTISMLHPFAFPFYRRYGWEFTIERKRYEIDMPLLPKPKNAPGRMERVPWNAESLGGLYEAFASKYNGTLARSPEWWKRMASRKQCLAAIWRNGNGVPEGYIIYDVQNRVLTVHEWAYSGEEARAAIWAFVANHDSMADKVHAIAPADDDLAHLLPDPRFKQETLPYFMSRIVDFEGLVGQYPFQTGVEQERLTVSVSDDQAPWNNGLFELVFEPSGQARLQRADSSARAELDCDIRALASMLLGSRRPQRLLRTGAVSGREEAIQLLERRIPRVTPYLMDFF